MSQNHKVAIVCSGGGMRSSYTGGALIALAKECALIAPDLIIASSGSAPFALYYLTGQYEDLKDIATHLLTTPKFISFLRPWRIMDIDYLIDVVFKRQRPLNVDALRMTQTRYYIPVTNARTKVARYISNDDSVDVFELLRSTTAIPVFFNKKVTIENQKYNDGTLSVSFADSIRKARELGATKIIAIDSQSQSRLPKWEAASDVFLIARRKNPAHLLTHDAATLERAYAFGYEDASNRSALETFLSDRS